MTTRPAPSTSQNAVSQGERQGVSPPSNALLARNFFMDFSETRHVVTAILLLLALTCFTTNDAVAQAPPTTPPSAPVDFSSITKPDVAAAIKISPEQQSLITQLISERDTAVAAAEEAARPAIIAAANEKLQAVLNPDQQSLFVSLFTGKKLRFNFRSQKWADVLDWIAKEADLSLVMEVPPPGVFNYSDSKDYSTVESIDLLNGWLLTKGFTLVRRERMLMCLDLKGGLPEGAIPKVTPEELETRGRYEFVSVLFPLEGRPAEIVLLEVKPLLGSYGKAEALAQTQQLLVIDTASNLRIVQQVITKVPMLTKAEGTPVLTVYPVEHANPQQAGEVLKTIIAGTIVIDIKARQISVNAVPSEQEKARIILGQLESNQGPDMQPRLQLYPVQVSDADQMLATLKLIAPDGQYRIDPLSSKLIAWASEADQKRISESLQMIQAEQPQGGARQLQVYALKNADPTAISTMLVYIVPTARVTVNTATRSLVAFGTLPEHEAIRALVEQLEKQTETAAAEKTLITYPVSSTVSTTLVTLMATAVPKAQVLSDTANQRLLVMATGDEHAQVDLLLKSLSTAESNGKQLQIHEADRIDSVSVTSLLTTLTPQATVTFDVANKRLLVVATEADQAKVAEVLEQVRTADADAVRSLKSYPLQPKIVSTTIISLLLPLVPKASAIPDEANRRLLITATEKEHELIAKVIEQVEKDAVGNLPELKFYPLKKVVGPTSLAVLQSVAPLARITFLSDGNRYSVLATRDDHTAIAATIEQLELNAAEIQRELKFYDVGAIGTADARVLLSTTFTDVTFVATAEGNKLMAWVSPAQDERIRATLEQLMAEKPFESTRTMELYSIAELGPSASTVLAQAVPKATISAGARADQLAIVATAEDHVKLKKVLEQLQGSKSIPPSRTLAVHPIKGLTPSSVLQVLQPLVDADVQLTVDSTGQQLYVRAFPDKQDQIKAVVEQVSASLANRPQRSTKTYMIGAPNADEAQEVLMALYPDAKIVMDADRKMIVATATDEQHATIDQIARQMKGTSLDGDVPVPAVYSLKNASATEVQTLLTSMYSRFDGVRLSVNEKTGRLIVVARKDQHDAIRPLIEQLDGPAETEVKLELAVFRLNQLDGLSVQTALQPLLPKNAQVTADRIGRQLFVSASADDMPAVRELVQQMITSQGSTEGLETRSYRLRPYEADEAQEVLTKLFPDATMVTDVSQEMLVATATAKQHETIKQVVEQMTSVLPMESAPSARAYPLRTADGDNAVEVFDAMFRRSDNVRVSFDSKTRSLIAVARPDQHAVIKALLDELEPSGAANETQTLEVYALGGMDGLTAVEVAEGVLRSIDSAATVSWEKASKQLVVTTTPAGHQQISAAMERFQESDPREMDVIQLRLLSASSAQNAIEGLYGDTFTNDDNYPVIQADEDSQQLLVRGSKKQLQDIRTLLIKMGETGLSPTGDVTTQANRNLRVIPIQGDVEPTLQKIQDLWPRVRRNPIRVLRPGVETPATEPQPQPKTDGQFSVPPEETSPPAATEPARASKEPTESQAAEKATAQAATDNTNAAATQPGQDEPSPVVIIPGTDRITIASDDIEALDQLESILRATSSSRTSSNVASRNRDFSVYQLRNAGAEEVAETLESIYDSRAGMLAFGSVVIVPETRMNALIVYGGRTDRDRIEQLLEILDTEKLPDSGRIFRTEVITVKHADAKKVQDVVQGVYRTEMTAGGTRRAIEIPTGIDSSVANVLRQINAASSAPLLTIEVQEETNSLVVKAPQNLVDEISELVTQLDETSATNRARGVTLIPLKKTNSRRVMQVLNDVLDQ